MNQGELPLAYEKVESNSLPEQRLSAARDATDLVSKVQKSALWAAYGDALGWISELTDEAGLRRRTGGAELIEPIGWKRRIGGRSGVTVSLPQGCYSDDSQLRLATGRAIRSYGFDVEAFSKVELPVWLSYELGGGKSTKAAATNLGNRKVKWFANTYRGWAMSGGNGAAMRIQPHVWAASNLKDAETFLPDVIRNAICTHSHPNGLLGACLHALTLAHTMSTGSNPTPDALMKAVDIATTVPDIVRNDNQLQYWLTFFEQDIGPFTSEWTQAIEECKRVIDSAVRFEHRTGPERYQAIADGLRLYDPECRGSGLLTSIAAIALIWCESQPKEALRIAANELGTDTDTIATMAGAILGATTESEPPVEVLDAGLFRSEADRLAEIARGGNPPCHQYPDLLHWNAPKTRSEALIRDEDGNFYILGLGRAEPKSEPLQSLDPKFAWRWVKLETGQSLLVKHGKQIATKAVIVDKPSTSKPSSKSLATPHLSQNPCEEIGNMQVAIEYLINHKDDDEKVGKAVRRIFGSGTTEQILQFLPTLRDCMRSTIGNT